MTDELIRHALITGGMGFIGSHLAESLLDRGAQVTLVDNLATGRAENVAHLENHPGVRLVVEDVTAEGKLDPLLTGCDIIFHLAAVVGVELVVQHPVETVHANVAGTEAVLQSAARHGTRVLIASSSEVYGKGSRLPFAEDDDVVLGPTSRSRWSYAASKMVDEFLTLGYAFEYGLSAIVFRLFNTVGPRQTGRYGMVITRFVDAALDGAELEVYGDGTQTRCFLHVDDAVDAILALTRCPAGYGQVFNIGATEPVTICRLAQMVLDKVEERTGRSGGRIAFRPPEEVLGPGYEDVHDRVPDLSKIRRYTGWEPTRSLSDILFDLVTATAANRGLLARTVSDLSQRRAAVGTPKNGVDHVKAT